MGSRSKQLTPTKEEQQQYKKDVAVLKNFNRCMSGGGKPVYSGHKMSSIQSAIKRVKRYEARYGTQ